MWILWISISFDFSISNIFFFAAVKIESNRLFGIQKTYSVLKQSREHLLRYQPKSVDELPARTMQDSFTSAVIPLSTDFELQDKYVTFLGSVRLGRLMEDMDQFAVWVVQQHVKIPNLDPSIPMPYTFVTLLVDRISFTDIIPKVKSCEFVSKFNEHTM